MKRTDRLERFLTTPINSDDVEISRSLVTKSNKHILSSTTFESTLLLPRSTSMHLEKNIYSAFKDDVLKLIAIIEQELKKTDHK